jgi:hypothetical protein
MTTKSRGEESVGNRKQSPNQWLEALAEDFGGWWGFGLGMAITLLGVVSGLGVVLAGGAIALAIAALATVAGWFTRK